MGPQQQQLQLFEAVTEQQAELVLQLKAAVACTVESHPELQPFCNDWTYVRHLRARGWSFTRALKMLQGTLQWRLDFKPHAITWGMVEEEARREKTFMSPYSDKQGRPVFVMRVRNNSHPQDIEEERRQLNFLIYNLELASRLADDQQVGKMTWLIDFVGSSVHSHPTMKMSIEVMVLLQNHYPERLGCVVCYKAPSFFSLIWRCASPFLDPVTRHKVDFVGQQHGSSGGDANSTGKPAATAAASGIRAAFHHLWRGKETAGADDGVAGPHVEAAISASHPDPQQRPHDPMQDHFDLDNVEVEMGGRHVGPLFDWEAYKQRMLAADDEVARALGVSPTTTAVSAPAMAERLAGRSTVSAVAESASEPAVQGPHTPDKTEGHAAVLNGGERALEGK